MKLSFQGGKDKFIWLFPASALSGCGEQRAKK